jgi:hypothetical protein
MNNFWLEKAKERLREQAAQPRDIPVERLRAQGMIDDSGEVTGHAHRWTAYLAVVEVKYASNKTITQFRCLMPVFGMPGAATIDVSRESMVSYLTEGKKVITATFDDRLKIWKEGSPIFLDRGFIITDKAVNSQDCIGSLPQFQQSTSGL